MKNGSPTYCEICNKFFFVCFAIFMKMLFCRDLPNCFTTGDPNSTLIAYDASAFGSTRPSCQSRNIDMNTFIRLCEEECSRATPACRTQIFAPHTFQARSSLPEYANLSRI